MTAPQNRLLCTIEVSRRARRRAHRRVQVVHAYQRDALLLNRIDELLEQGLFQDDDAVYYVMAECTVSHSGALAESHLWT